MDVALLNLVGAGIAAYAAGAGVAVPAGSLARGQGLVRDLAERDEQRVQALVERIVGGLLGEWQAARMPTSVTEHHAGVLPALMDVHRPDAQIASEVVLAARSAPETRPAGARLLAMATATEAVAAGALERVDLTEAAALRTMEQLYRHLLDEAAVLDEMLGVIGEILGRPAASPLPATEPVEAVISGVAPAAEIGVFPAAGADVETATPADGPDEAGATIPRAVLSEEISSRIRSPSTATRLIEIGLQASGAVIGELKIRGDGSPDIIELRRNAGERLAAGDLAAADGHLSAIEDIAVRLAQTELQRAGHHLALAAEARCIRGRIDDLCANFRRAARHYHAASRCLPLADHIGRSRMQVRQGLALMRQGEHAGDLAALDEAVTAFTEASGAGLAQHAPDEWADVQLTLARLLVIVGERGKGEEAFAASVDHARAALACFVAGRSPGDWIRGCIILGDALRCLGDSRNSRPHLAEAMESYGEALRLLGGAAAGAEWAAATFGIGLVRLKLGETEGLAGHFEECLADTGALLAAVEDAVVDADIARLHAARGRALLGLYALRNQPTLARDAADAFGAALEAMSASASPREVATIRHRRALTLWAIGASEGDCTVLGQAAQDLLAVLDDCERCGDNGQAEDVRDDLMRLHDDMEAATVRQHSSMPEDTAST